MAETIKVARCPRHGIHGQRDRCFVCDGPVEQVELVPDRWYERALVAEERLAAAIETLKFYANESEALSPRDFEDDHGKRAKRTLAEMGIEL